MSRDVDNRNFHCLLTQNFNIDHDILRRIRLDGADVGPRVLHGDGLDDQDPVVVSLTEDGVTRISGECQVTHRQQIQRRLPGHGPRYNRFLDKTKLVSLLYQGDFYIKEVLKYYNGCSPITRF